MVSPEDIVWAKQALADGRSMTYIASVLEMTEKKARKAVFAAADSALRVKMRDPVIDEVGPLPGEKRAMPHKLEEPEIPFRRKALLRRRFAKHWSMIWYLRAKRMSGRTLRKIYGSEALIWSVGGGIDVEI